MQDLRIEVLAPTKMHVETNSTCVCCFRDCFQTFESVLSKVITLFKRRSECPSHRTVTVGQTLPVAHSCMRMCKSILQHTHMHRSIC